MVLVRQYCRPSGKRSFSFLSKARIPERAMITVGHRSVVPPGLYSEANMLQSRSLQKLGHQLRKIGDQSLDYLADRREGMIHFCGEYMKEC